MKVFGWVLLLAVFALPVAAQDCDHSISDQAGVLGIDDLARLATAGHPLMEEGADLRIVTYAHSANLDLSVDDTRKACTSWQSPAGGMKSTLVVLALAPTDHHMGIYYGSAWHGALDAHFARIKAESMLPHFKARDWAGGFIATEQQLAARIHASKDEALHPAVSTTTYQATDLTGLWTFFGWLLAIAAIAFVAYILYRLRRQRSVAEQNRRQARANAINAKVHAAYVVTKNAVAQAEFDRLGQQLKNDPYSDDLATEDYEAIKAQYDKVSETIKNEMNAAPSTRPPRAEPPKVWGNTGHGKHTKRFSDLSELEKSREIEPSTRETVYRDSTTVIPVPIVIPESEPYREPDQKRKREPDPEPEPEPSHSHSSDDSGGGSSSWSDDSSSSSSSDSGGSSDFGSNDSGSSGGGSSDF